MSDGKLNGEQKEPSKSKLELAVAKTKAKMDRKLRLTLKNFDPVEFLKDDGTLGIKNVGLEAVDIWNELKNMSGNYIKRVGDQVFANGGGKIIYMNKAEALFGWIASRGVHTEWAKSRDAISKAEFLSYIGNVAEAYDYASAYPHFPAVKGFYYVNKIEPKSNGKLDELIDFFTPDTNKDRAMLKAAFVTPAWGRCFGNRPGFLIVARDDDEKQGKGTGKTTITDMISAVYSGHVDLSKKSDDETIRKALMSAQDVRIARIDNIKGGAFTSETIESLMTSPNLSAHRLYKGHAIVPNVYTFFITFNDAELSQDFSQRFMTIRVKRPVYNSEWLTKINDFIAANRDAILADIGALIIEPYENGKTVTRYPTWEREILSKCVGSLELASLHAAIEVDRDSVDEMNNLKEEFSEYCRERIAIAAGMDPENSTFAIRQAWVVKWLIEFKGGNLSRKSARKLLSRILPQGFSKDTQERDGIDYMIWSGVWHLGDNGGSRFSPTSALRLVFAHGETSTVEWKFNGGGRKVEK